MSSLFLRTIRSAAPRAMQQPRVAVAVPCRFVAKQEREALARMVAKMQADADPGHKKALSDLEKKLQAAGVTVDEKTKQALLAWKHTAH